VAEVLGGRTARVQAYRPDTHLTDSHPGGSPTGPPFGPALSRFGSVCAHKATSSGEKFKFLERKTGFEPATLTLAIRSPESAHLELSESVQLRGSKECAGV
jgi:hypothetical protein